MTHTIFVTVEEFLQNGGELVRNRIIYNWERRVLGCLNDTDVVSDTIQIRCLPTNTLMSVYITATFVDIEATPIYK